MLIYSKQIFAGAYEDVFQGTSTTGTWEVRIRAMSPTTTVLSTSTSTPTSPTWAFPDASEYVIHVQDQPLYIHNVAGSGSNTVHVVVTPLLSAHVGLC